MGKILIVDDEAHVIRLLRDYLTSKNYEVYTATNGLEAIEKVKDVMPHIVFLDIIMPGLGGIETLREIKKINPKIWVAGDRRPLRSASQGGIHAVAGRVPAALRNDRSSRACLAGDCGGIRRASAVGAACGAGGGDGDRGRSCFDPRRSPGSGNPWSGCRRIGLPSNGSLKVRIGIEKNGSKKVTFLA